MSHLSGDPVPLTALCTSARPFIKQVLALRSLGDHCWPVLQGTAQSRSSACPLISAGAEGEDGSSVAGGVAAAGLSHTPASGQAVVAERAGDLQHTRHEA